MTTFSFASVYEIMEDEYDALQDINSLPDLLYQRQFQVVGKDKVSRLINNNVQCFFLECAISGGRRTTLE